MGVILRQHGSKQRHVQIANSAVRDDRLSLKARGLLALLLSHQDGWVTSERRIAERCQEGRHAVATGLAELEEHGYLYREQPRNEDGTMGTSAWHMTDEPTGEPLPNRPRPDNPAADDTATKNTKGSEDQEQEHDEEEAPAVAAVDDSPFPDVASEETIGQARRLCNVLAAYVKRNGHAIPTTSSARDGWLVEMERLVRIGPPGDVDWPEDPDAAAEEIERVMLWALDVSDFWPANIRSAPTLRAKFTQLRAQANRSGRGRRTGRTPSSSQLRAAAARMAEQETG